MLTPEQIKERLLASADDDFVRDVILAGEAAHVTPTDVAYIGRRLAETYQVAETDVGVWIVGSAKLGYSLSEKRGADDLILPRFRPFRIDSDIDIAIISRPIFDAVWSDLSRHANHASRLPWESGKLGKYLVHGWLRPDYFPRRSRLRHCDAWWDQFRRFSADSRFRRRKVRGGLFYSAEHLVRYQSRSVAECRRALELE